MSRPTYKQLKLRLDEQTWQTLKQKAAAEKRSLNSVIVAMLNVEAREVIRQIVREELRSCSAFGHQAGVAREGAQTSQTAAVGGRATAAGGSPVPLKLTEEELEAARSPRGGWTARTLAGWGVPWPAPRGWRKALLRGEPIPTVEAE